jgi:hypothetical protein
MMLRRTQLSCALLGGLAVVATLASGRLIARAQGSAGARAMPVFELDPKWPQIPNNWVFGNVSEVTVDKHDHVWILQRPKSLPQNMKDHAAPSVLEYDNDGRYVNGWGGEASGYDWPLQPHGITVDHKDNVWITGAGYATIPAVVSDDMILKFTNKGKFLLQIGGRTTNHGNADTKNLNRSAEVFVYSKTNEAFVADGYGNRRVIVFNADTGAFKRMWGAFGNKPEDGPQGLFGGGPIPGSPAPAGEPGRGEARGGGAGAGRGRGPGPDEQQIPVLDTDGSGGQQFSVPVHSVKVSNDGLVYVAARVDRRVQVTTTDGKYQAQVFINRSGPARQSAVGLAFSPDAQQRFLYVADFGNSRVVVLERKKLEVLYQFGNRSANPGDFQGIHFLATDSKGNLYTAEVAPGNRAQKFVFKGLSDTPPANALPQSKISQN